jgi:hypothetical protein
MILENHLLLPRGHHQEAKPLHISRKTLTPIWIRYDDLAGYMKLGPAIMKFELY